MKDGKKIQYNLIVGIAGQLAAMVLGILVPKLVLVSYGSEVNGLLSSVTNIYAYIAIVEAGVAAATCQALYKTIAQNDRDQTNAVLSATNIYYHKTGIIYLGLILMFSIVYPACIQTDIPYTTVVLIILFNGFGNVVNYFLHGKYLILLKADGKNYIRTGLEMITNAFKQISKIVLIALGYDVVVVQLVAMVAGFIQVIAITCYIKKNYAWIDLRVKPDKKAISKSKNVLVHEINYLITNNVDTVLLTVFTNLKIVSVYSLYTLLLSMVTRVLQTIRDAVEFKIAHEYHTDRRNFLRMFETYEVYSITLVFSLFSVVNYFLLPFISLYTKGITDVNYIDQHLPFAFIIVQLLFAGRYPSDAMVHIAGHFRQTQTSAVVETVLNLSVSIILVQFFGIYGALMGTVVSSLFRTNYLILYVNKHIIGRNPFQSYKCWIVNFCVYSCVAYLNRLIAVPLDSYLRVFAFCIPYGIGTVILYFTVASALHPQAFRYALGIVKQVIDRKK